MWTPPAATVPHDHDRADRGAPLRLSPHQKVSVIAHELAHVHAGHVDAAPGEYQQHRGQMDRSGSGAYITCRKLGIDRDTSQAFPPAYIASTNAPPLRHVTAALRSAVSS